MQPVPALIDQQLSPACRRPRPCRPAAHAPALPRRSSHRLVNSPTSVPSHSGVTRPGSASTLTPLGTRTITPSPPLFPLPARTTAGTGRVRPTDRPPGAVLRFRPQPPAPEAKSLRVDPVLAPERARQLPAPAPASQHLARFHSRPAFIPAECAPPTPAPRRRYRMQSGGRTRSRRAAGCDRSVPPIAQRRPPSPGALRTSA